MTMKPTTVTTGQVRLSYVHLTQPYARPGQEPRYSVTVLLPKSDVATKQRIDAAIEAAIQEGITRVWNGVRPPMIKTPIYDGDGVRPNGEPFGPECKGHWVFTASSKQPVEIVDLSLNPIINPTEIYSGMYARVNINFFPFNQNGNRGIGCGLGPVQKVADGEPLGGRAPTAQEAFGAPMAPQPAPQPAAPAYSAPVYGAAQPAAAPQPGQTIDPITGRPLSGGVMGL
ncbi:MAG: DUF2815 family protein [Alicyclobacillus macrosporangiidus]|uniref:DUF2815 family protein n=1 Tax=Alicyclobacillus macrosporangiidus TaxID=392015 RepID=UPI0026EF49A8|nr:DUF2815 family protein [Alicyclobacillus macrosporangiidus]MCL6598967.1 DUF2815 family protein [Alicyclobacillus macrosporangiidus]